MAHRQRFLSPSKGDVTHHLALNRCFCLLLRHDPTLPSTTFVVGTSLPLLRTISFRFRDTSGTRR